MSSHFRRIAPAELARLWADPKLKKAEIAARVGLSEKGLLRRIKAQGLEPRSLATKQPSIPEDSIFAALWAAGVPAREIAQHFGVDQKTIGNTRRRLGLPLRTRGKRCPITLAEFLEDRHRAALEALAKAEAGHWKNAEMVDLKSKLWWKS